MFIEVSAKADFSFNDTYPLEAATCFEVNGHLPSTHANKKKADICTVNLTDQFISARRTAPVMLYFEIPFVRKMNGGVNATFN